MKKLAMIVTVFSVLAFTVAHAQPLLGEEGAKKSSDGKVIFPKEIENCEPCKRLWLANNLKHKKSAVVQGNQQSEGAKKSQTMDVKN